MKRLIAALSLLVMMAPAALAGPCDEIMSDGYRMEDAVIIELKKKCVELTDKAAPESIVNNVAEYAELGKKYGVAIAEVAKSLGVTANELAQTPVGKFMLVMVAWRVMGEDIVGYVGAFLWFTVMLPFWWILLRKLVLSTRKERKVYSREHGKTNEVVESVLDPVDYNGPAGGILTALLIGLILICASGFLMAFA